MTRARPPHEGLRQELRRGTLVLAVLISLRQERYGADLIERLAKASVPIEPGALYPMLRRLEDQGLLASEWRVEDGRRRRFYRSSAAGLDVAEELANDLIQLVASLQALRREEDDADR
ncbi:PadR family transcriptional regulator [Caulobacter sp. UNC358MFTsu5.1]|uniref:PadR family transcriptional regulator n=1 Tax=Caulobacter sp. UNC358MFTsu5.1 TaxID=1449049 RepID=UPI0004A6AB64|nr:helix-turn-helix transcriptional regulator [Caulobacter sp. UNC358MFTsu5.1]